jgi:solute carrier family 34 (sodium-dependent phosphate cotransporter)
MSKSFRLIAGKYANKALQSQSIISNPMAGLMVGIGATAVVQSSSTSTSILISMVASGSNYILFKQKK